ncbi:MAG: transcription antitermination factor NusB [Nitrospirota bacterium]|nr:transcription antitermination factor NusB [Nitrospirota bacterium]
MSSRRKARELALQYLYCIDLNQEGFSEKGLKQFWSDHETAEGLRAFTERLIRGVVAERANIDGMIQTYAENWSLDRIAAVDRNVLRLAVYEILKEPDIPLNVTINEAIEVARKFSSDESGTFINGLLDRIGKVMRKEEPVKTGRRTG